MVSKERNVDSGYKNKIANVSDLAFLSSDSYNNLIADNTLHLIDLPSTYPFSSERLLYIENGSTTSFADSAKTTDNPSTWTLSASAGDVLEIESKQRIRYVPGYEIECGLAFYLSDSLPDGAELIVKHGRDNDAFLARYTNSGATYELHRGGSIINTVEFTNPVPLTQPQIDKARSNLYGVGASKLYKYYLDENYDDYFDLVAQVGDLTAVSVDDFNLPLNITLDCSGASSGVDLNVLSMQAKKRGNANRIDRSKKFVEFGLGGSIASDAWSALLAMRKASTKENIVVNISEVTAIPTDRMKIVGIAVDSSQTDASGFSASTESLGQNDAIEVTTNVSTPTSISGRQMIVMIADAANVNKARVTKEKNITGIYDDDVIVFLAKTKSASGSSVDMAVKTLQEW